MVSMTIFEKLINAEGKERLLQFFRSPVTSCFLLIRYKLKEVLFMTDLKRTPIFEHYKEYGAKTIDFGGWELPVQFSSIKEEHEAVRTKVGLFDVSHMGEVIVTGPDSLNYLQKM